MPHDARALVEVQRLARLAAGAGLDAPLFANSVGGSVRTDGIRRWLRRADELAGVGMPGEEVRALWDGPGPKGFRVQVRDVRPVRSEQSDGRLIDTREADLYGYDRSASTSLRQSATAQG